MGINIFIGCGSVFIEFIEFSIVVFGLFGVGFVISVVFVRCIVGFDVMVCVGFSWIIFWFLIILVVGVGN